MPERLMKEQVVQHIQKASREDSEAEMLVMMTPVLCCCLFRVAIRRELSSCAIDLQLRNGCTCSQLRNVIAPVLCAQFAVRSSCGRAAMVQLLRHGGASARKLF